MAVLFFLVFSKVWKRISFKSFLYKNGIPLLKCRFKILFKLILISFLPNLGSS